MRPSQQTIVDEEKEPVLRCNVGAYELAFESEPPNDSRRTTVAFFVGVDLDVFRPNAQNAFAFRKILPRRFDRAGVAGNKDAAAASSARRQDVAFANETGNEAVGRAIVNFYRRTDLTDHPTLHDRDAVRHREGLFLVVGDVDCSNTKTIDDGPNFGAQMSPDLGIERG